MPKKLLTLAALAFAASAAVFLIAGQPDGEKSLGRPGFVRAQGGRFFVDGRPFRFVGANVSVMFRDEDRARRLVPPAG